jgi:hypothetical protein
MRAATNEAAENAEIVARKATTALARARRVARGIDRGLSSVQRDLETIAKLARGGLTDEDDLHEASRSASSNPETKK